MINLLSRESGQILAQIASARVLLAFDFDGTLAPIAEDRDDARMRDRTCALLTEVCRLYPCAVISGRAMRDVQERLGGAPVKYVVGNHGLEPGGLLTEFEHEVTVARPLLEAAMAGYADVDIEDKRYSLAIHYRRSRQKRAARAAIQEAVDNLPTPMRTVPGKSVVNVIPQRAPNKGDALLALRAVEHADTAFYIGDDVTDEDVFGLDQPGRLLSVRVGESSASAAAYCLRNQQEIDRLLARLIALREERAEHHGR